MPGDAQMAPPGQPLSATAAHLEAGIRSPSLAKARSAVGPPSSAVPPFGLPYLRVVTRFRVSIISGLAWVGLSTWIALPWISELAQSVTLPGAWIVVIGIALAPGYLNMQLVTSLLMDRPAPVRLDLDFPALTLLVAAFNEQSKIAGRVQRLRRRGVACGGGLAELHR
jgi:hypothetical protein